ncbi:22306_t:CDS:1 [Entrophospora sp. SA101]|nr:7529_t:CDS:1 [Entrophospora sp. SA101]CAJ0746341.1 22306_t:CDS:1 [Entrophospora sp. SA101]CAJ0895236.1 5718_t:CDS:1 [Entrophospora sp. SA101]CAJ0913601.1 12619_t:CDS:1 [Entrophospora sp. SA101]
MKRQTDTSWSWEELPTKTTNETFVTMDTKNVNEGLTTACFNIPQTISGVIDIIKNTSVDDEIERIYVTTACSRCQKRHIKCDDRKPSCCNCEEKGCECIRIQPELRRGRPRGTLNGQGKHPKRITNNGFKKTRKPRKKQSIESNNAKFNNTIKELLNHEGVGFYGNNNNDPSTLGFYNGLTPSSSFQSRSPTHLYSFTSSHDTYDINNNNTVYRSSNLTDSPIQDPFSFFDIPNRYNVHQFQIPPENTSDFVLGPNALSLTTNIDLDIVDNNYEGEYHNVLMDGSLDTFNSSTPMDGPYVDYFNTHLSYKYSKCW